MLTHRHRHVNTRVTKQSLISLVHGLNSPFVWSNLRRSCAFTSVSEHLTRKVVFSGIQPTGIPHIGNYLGALRQWVALQNEASPDDTLIYSIVDLHAHTVPQDPEQLQRWKYETLATLLAVGLDPFRSKIFFQSAVGTKSLNILFAALTIRRSELISS